MSSKHLLTTTSAKIEFNKEFYNFFSIIANEIMLNNDNDELDMSDYSLLIIKDNIVQLNALDEGQLNEFVTIFHIKNNKTGEIIEMREKEGNDLYISTELKEALGLGKHDSEVYEVSFNDIPDDTKLFILEIENNELTRPLYNIMGLV